MSDTEWTDDDIESMLKAVLFALSVGAIIAFVFAPRGGHQDPNRNHQQPQRRRQPRDQGYAHARRQRQPTTGGGAAALLANQQQQQLNDNNNEDEDGIQAFLKHHVRRPPHHLDPSMTNNGNGGTLVFAATSSAHRHDGILPFRLTKASVHESKVLAKLVQEQQRTSSSEENGHENNDKDNDKNKYNDVASSKALENKKDRARIFAKLFATNNLTPPSRGGTLVLSIPTSIIAHVKMSQILISLGTYYNLFVMVAVTVDDDGDNGDGDDEKKASNPGGSGNGRSASEYHEDKKRSDEIVQKFYTNDSTSTTALSRDALPSHRIVITQSVPSRIAFVRSFPKNPDYVIGFDEEDEELLTQLTKFGYNVMLHKSVSIFGSS